MPHDVAYETLRLETPRPHEDVGDKVTKLGGGARTWARLKSTTPCRGRIPSHWDRLIFLGATL
jgi:hypothetical protein